ncbi:MAG: molybdopterin molybdotransferase MoeA, partial [Candidatus Eremiobacteraeota bacterium]|nr:molybdopterin molybdotransferase MoeA [Candidatus Eremiobacteraeota bacterium]
PVEDTGFDASYVEIAEAIATGENVNARAGDMRAGEPVLARGTRIGAPHLGVLATLGVVSVPVCRRPIVAIVSSGDELVPPSKRPCVGEIRDSNRYAVAGSLRAMGVEPRHFPTVRDEAGALAAALSAALAQCDAAIVTGGSSVGERDRTPQEIASLGTPGVIVHGIKVKPGKPTVLAAIGRKPVVGLPGNPTSALTILEAIAAPIFAAMTGALPCCRAVTAILDGSVSGRAGWTWFLPVALRHEPAGLVAHPLALHSSEVSLTARAGGYLTVENGETLCAGTPVQIRRFA